jgi:hypothetical protein
LPLSCTATIAPVRARRFAIADPMLLEAPVTIATGLETMADFPWRQRSLPGDEALFQMRVYLSDTVLSHRTQFRRHSQKGAG